MAPWLGRTNSSQPPTKLQRCVADPQVQKAVATVLATKGTVVGLIVMLNTGWWGSRSDLWGRRAISAIGSLATIISTGSVILVVLFGHLLPGKQYWWTLPADIVAGLLGGTVNYTALQAYISDSTEPGSRSSYFALFAGCLMGAVAVGPIFGAGLVRATKDNLSVFYVILGIRVFTLLLWIFVIPESLASETRSENIKKHEEALIERSKVSSQAWSTMTTWQRARKLCPDFLVDLLAPLAILLPHRPSNDISRRRDWTLTTMAFTLLLFALCAGAMSTIMQLGQKLFQWDGEMVGYWLSILGLSRAAYLFLVFPVIVHLFKPKPQAIALPSPEEQLHSNDQDESSDLQDASTTAYKASVAKFDLRVVRVSLLMDFLGYSAGALSATEGQFILSTAGLAVGAGLGSALMSLALASAPGGEAEAGKLIGAISFITSLGAEVLGEGIFGMVYRSTVATFPRTALVVASALMGLAFLSSLLIRLPRVFTSSVGSNNS